MAVKTNKQTNKTWQVRSLWKFKKYKITLTPKQRHPTERDIYRVMCTPDSTPEWRTIGVKGGANVSSHDASLSFTPLCQRTRLLLQGRKKKVYDLRLINLSLLAHFKERQDHFEVYLPLTTFFKPGSNSPLPSLSSWDITSSCNQRKGQHMCLTHGFMELREKVGKCF